MLHALVIDGTLNREEVQAAGMSEEEAMKLCRKENLPQKEILLLGIDDAGKVTVIRKEKKQAKEAGRTDKEKK